MTSNPFFLYHPAATLFATLQRGNEENLAIGHLHKRGRVWYARYKDQSGKLRWKSLETNSKEIAEAKLNKLKEALEKQELGWRLAPKPIQKYLEEYLSICSVEHSKRTYRVEKPVLNEFIKFTAVQYLHQMTADLWSPTKSAEPKKKLPMRCSSLSSQMVMDE